MSSHVLWIVCGRLPLRRYRGLGQPAAPVMDCPVVRLTCMVEIAVARMSVSLAEETAVKDPQDDGAFRADDVQMGAEWLDGLRTRQRKRRSLILSRKLKPRLLTTTVTENRGLNRARSVRPPQNHRHEKQVATSSPS